MSQRVSMGLVSSNVASASTGRPLMKRGCVVPKVFFTAAMAVSSARWSPSIWSALIVA
jgi:hypothetical protein